PSRIEDPLHKQPIPLTEMPPLWADNESLPRRLSAAEGMTDYVIEARVIGHEYFVPKRPSVAAQIHVFGNSDEPFRKTTNLSPNVLRYPHACAHDHREFPLLGRASWNGTCEQVEILTPVD